MPTGGHRAAFPPAEGILMHRRMASLLAIVALAASVAMAARAPAGGRAESRGPASREEAEERAQDARSLLQPPAAGSAETSTVSRAPAPGWQSESLWSPTANDWEPAIA